MLKPISITLPEKMIDQIDEMLFEKDFASRSDFFRHLVRMWFVPMQSVMTGQEEQEAGDQIDLEYGIPKGVIRKIEEQAKLIN